jgi:hypothetical protein
MHPCACRRWRDTALLGTENVLFFMRLSCVVALSLLAALMSRPATPVTGSGCPLSGSHLPLRWLTLWWGHGLIGTTALANSVGWTVLAPQNTSYVRGVIAFCLWPTRGSGHTMLYCSRNCGCLASMPARAARHRSVCHTTSDHITEQPRRRHQRLHRHRHRHGRCRSTRSSSCHRLVHLHPPSTLEKEGL